jgi:hypothetical protein
MRNIVAKVFLLTLALAFALPASAIPIELTFDVRLDRQYSYDGSALHGIAIGDVRPMRIIFDNAVTQYATFAEPWGPGTAWLWSFLAGPVTIDSPFTPYVPDNPFANPVPLSFQAIAVTSNERLPSGVWYEDLWFNRQYDQFIDVQPDGMYAYRSKLNVHWNKTNFNYTPGDLYFYTSDDVMRLLDRSVNDGITFNLSDDAYIEYANGNASGFDLNGTATLRGYRVIQSSEPLPEPGSCGLITAGILMLLFNGRRKHKPRNIS